MANLQLKGPRNKDSGLVQYHTTFLRSGSREQGGLIVTFQLGDKLRHCTGDDHINNQSAPIQNGLTQAVFFNAQKNEYNSHPKLPISVKPSPETAIATPPLNGTSTAAPEPDTEQNSDSDIEIIEVRTVHSLRSFHGSAPVGGSSSSVQIGLSDDTGRDTDGYSSSELSALDSQINQVLAPTLTTSAQPPFFQRRAAKYNEPSVKNMPPIHTLLPEFFKPHASVKGPPPPGYRNIPPNLVYAINRELNIWMETSADDDIEMVEKLVFTLKDPIVKTKIRLPIKATTCRHFECFDFQTFCEFHSLKPGVKSLLKSSLVEQSREARAAENLFLKQQQRIATKTLRPDAPEVLLPFFSEHGQMFFTELYNRTPPLYKCPLCDEKFGLKQLYISDIFNFFVKTTPLHITKVQLEGSRFKIIEDDKLETTMDDAEIVDLSDEDDEIANAQTANANHSDTTPDDDESVKSNTDQDNANNVNISMTADDFNDGLDEVLLRMSKGDGSWSHPVTLD